MESLVNSDYIDEVKRKKKTRDLNDSPLLQLMTLVQPTAFHPPWAITKYHGHKQLKFQQWSNSKTSTKFQAGSVSMINDHWWWSWWKVWKFVNFQLFPHTALHAKDPLEKAQGHCWQKHVSFQFTFTVILTILILIIIYQGRLLVEKYSKIIPKVKKPLVFMLTRKLHLSNNLYSNNVRFSFGIDFPLF